MRWRVSEYRQLKGRAVLEYARMERVSLRARSRTELKTPRAMTWRSILENQISTWFSQDEYVGVKWSFTFGCS
jgi:hypothetical protein